VANERAKIRMSDEEVARFLETSRTMTMCTLRADGTPHLVAMWYALVDGVVWFETKAKSQKVANLRRNPKITCMVEAGDTYDQLRGVSLEGTAEVVDDRDALWKVGVSVFERYTGPVTDESTPIIEMMLQKRVAVKVNVDRVVSWDHRKLGLPAMPAGGTTAITAADR
jgi:PPOX class probable F420-dependent enzyme